MSRANDNFVRVIDRTVLHRVCRVDKDLASIRYLQSQFASRIVNRWKRLVHEHKKNNNRPLYRSIRFGDEKAKSLEMSTSFKMSDAPIVISQARDRKRREKMAPMLSWTFPQKLSVPPIVDGDAQPVLPGRDSEERKKQKERVSGELEEFSIGAETLKEPKSLPSNRESVSSSAKPVIIPLETETTSPSPEKKSAVVPSAPSVHAPSSHPMVPPPPPGHPAGPYRGAPNYMHGHGHGYPQHPAHGHPNNGHGHGYPGYPPMPGMHPHPGYPGYPHPGYTGYGHPPHMQQHAQHPGYGRPPPPNMRAPGPGPGWHPHNMGALSLSTGSAPGKRRFTSDAAGERPLKRQKMYDPADEERERRRERKRLKHKHKKHKKRKHGTMDAPCP